MEGVQLKSLLYIDMSDVYRNKGKTGIQRVVKELYSRMVNDNEAAFRVVALVFNQTENTYDELEREDVIRFFDGDIETCRISSSIKPDELKRGSIFYDIDAAWNISHKRPYLYPILKNRGIRIVSYIYDLVPLLIPKVSHENTVKNFALYMAAVIAYADLVMCDSRSTEKDFIDMATAAGSKRHIPTVVTMLGSDFEIEKSNRSENKEVSSLRKKKYILFVGTIEPRKRQSVVLEAFEKIALRHPGLELVFVGRKGWNADAIERKIKSSRYFGKRVHWLQGLDDYNVKRLYENAYICTYLSEYEGFGLPVAEPLGLGKVTVASYNSSIPEVGGAYVDYVFYNSPSELAETLTVLLDDDALYAHRVDQLSTYSPYLWKNVYQTVKRVLNGVLEQKAVASTQKADLQGVVISIDIHRLKNTMDEMAKYMQFITHYVLVTPLRYKRKAELALANFRVKIITDEELLGDEITTFRLLDHQEKNWLLRARLIQNRSIEDSFIMFDDDSRPLKKVKLERFLTKEGIYRGYYFYDIDSWSHYETDYDKGQHKTARVLRESSLERLSYSAHMPQIIDKKIYLEMLSSFSESGVDEWSMYFNYLATRYPYRIQKCKFITMSWPALPSDWQHTYRPSEYVFENYYDHLYEEGGVFQDISHDNNKKKINLKREQIADYYDAVDKFDYSKKYIDSADIAHGCAVFKIDNSTNLYVWGIPYMITTSAHTCLRINLKYKIISRHENNFLGEVAFSYHARGYSSGQVRIVHDERSKNGSSEGLISLPVISKKSGIKDVSFYVKLNGEIVENETVYAAKLIVQEEGTQLEDYF